MFEVNGDLVEDKKFDVFCHQTNCRGVMGAGIALQIKRAYPEVAAANENYFVTHKSDAKSMLGTNLYINTHDGRTCVNLYAQEEYGRGGSRKTDYNAFNQCMVRLAKKLSVSDPSIKVGFPYGIGCGLGGGDWETIYRMIKSMSEEVKQDVYIVRYRN